MYIDQSATGLITNGTIEQPFYNYAAAVAYALSNGASATKPFGIVPIGIFNITGDMPLYPFINIVGQGQNLSQFNISGQLLYDSSWDSTANPSFLAQDCSIFAAGGASLHKSFRRLPDNPYPTGVWLNY